MSHLRPECGTSTRPALPDDTALFLIRDSVERRKELAYGKLHTGGRDCAIGAFFEDNPKATRRGGRSQRLHPARTGQREDPYILASV